MSPWLIFKKGNLSFFYVTLPYNRLPAQIPLKTLTVKVGGVQTDVELITSVLQRAPHLSHLHLAGMRLPTGSSQSQLLATLSGTVYQPDVYVSHLGCTSVLSFI